MSQDCPIACIACGTVLQQACGDDSHYVQPSEGTAFQTYGHYGSTFWDSFDGEQIEVVVCDECLEGNKDRIMRVKRWIPVIVFDPTKTVAGVMYRVDQSKPYRIMVGRYFIERAPVPYFYGPEDDTAPMEIDPEKIGEPFDAVEPYPSRIEWRGDWRKVKATILDHYAAEEGEG